ncbi:molybdenum cofactor biosynthesis protein MoaE [Geobacter sp. SVR]|uniref:molybdenum cofactor biosynthesis protein MoaE n=1 Tax=Geobacter sp. SVR TaxID=2495594 RepID=UPI00143EFF88|nr:molybdenum cofactor biosynthesis protein MoaE [Geobacter sp. SVR]BCS52510.1 molybdopterin synthase [Geobacter sp. SVR]GCF84053.1 molybdopterin synthase [Geobacter sp. SVR]
MVSFTPDPIDPAAAHELLRISEDGRNGSVLLHYAVVKQQASENGITTGIEYQAVGDVEENLKAIEFSMKEGWRLHEVLLLRRSGTVKVGEIISLVGVASPSSDDAFAACRFGLESFKKMYAIAKREIYG